MKKPMIITAICITALSLIAISDSGKPVRAGTGKKKIYYFYAEYCEACKRAQDHFKKPANIGDGSPWVFDDLTFTSYRLVDENNKIVKKNINRLISMCESIKKRTGKSEFVYYNRETYEYYNKKGIPHYKKQGRYVKRDAPFPTPVFIIGDRVILGFNLNLITNAVSLQR